LATRKSPLIIKINPSTWRIEKQARFQNADQGTNQFIGSYSFNKNEDLITLARPFSSDVVLIDKDLNIKYYCKIGRQPLESVVLDNKKVIARDWKSGDFLTGSMKFRFFWNR
jgi:hypothetical protein